MADRKWSPSSNLALVAAVRSRLDFVRRTRKVTFEWVKGHSGDVGNGRADRNADLGASGLLKLWPRRRLVGKQTVVNVDTDASTLGPRKSPKINEDCGYTSSQGDWTNFAKLLTDTAKDVVGTKTRNKLNSPYSFDDMASFQTKMKENKVRREEVCASVGTAEEAGLRRQLTAARESLNHFKQECRNRWVSATIAELDNAIAAETRARKLGCCSDLRRFHQLLPKLGIRADGYSSQGKEDFTLEAARAHMIKVGSNPLHVSEETLNTLPHPRPEEEWLGYLPSLDEVSTVLAGLKESSPGCDGVTALMMRISGDRGRRIITGIARRLWTSSSETWEE
eukprot:16436155-Heterocapsa_arctica.AAC.1